MLVTQLKQQAENLIKLQEILEAEKACLTTKDFSTFNDILFNKQKMLNVIITLDKQLSTDQVIEQLQQDEPLNDLKKNLQQQLIDCQKLNNINGRLVELSMKSNKHLMQLITQATGTNSVTYDQKGLLNSGSLLGKNIQA